MKDINGTIEEKAKLNVDSGCPIIVAANETEDKHETQQVRNRGKIYPQVRHDTSIKYRIPYNIFATLYILDQKY